MAKFTVYGNTIVSVAVRVEADTEEEARELAGEQFNGLTSYVGNGSTDKLVGVNDSDISIEPGEGWDITDVEESE